MKFKKLLAVATVTVTAGALLTYALVDFLVEPSSARLPASVPADYQALSGCSKQEILWQKVQASTYQELPDYRAFGIMQILAMSKQEVALKGSHHDDFAPEGWKKYLHGRGAIAKVKLVATSSNDGGKYSGIFKGAECALLRLSLTYKTASNRAVAPGLAFKVLRDGTESANVSALVSLSGQDNDYNFFARPMSNIVPIGHDLGQKLVHKIFRSASRYPEELMITEMASTDSKGVKSDVVTSPRQIFFVPSGDVVAASNEHDVRKDFLSIPSGTAVYKVYAAPASAQSFDYSEYSDEKAIEFLKSSDHIANIVTTSEFLASAFGDDGIFFRHQLRP
ncbi:MAG: hypothetical protein EOP06_14280 [Proteobacteria bacterium]|nr:MAG: hypothetical protein EOP06_14280 [Pseudomonadota bacterium]